MAVRRESQSKGQRTRQRIVEEAAVLFNMRGIAGASMADVSEATGLEKGGVYNHFATKEELSLAAFEYAATYVRARIETAFSANGGCLAKLRALLDSYRHALGRPLLKGGCPIMNTAIEADDTNPELRRRARAEIEHWRSLIAAALDEGMRTGEIRRVDASSVASTVVATIEGGVMLAKLYGDASHLRAAVDHLEWFLDSLARRERAHRV